MILFIPALSLRITERRNYAFIYPIDKRCPIVLITDGTSAAEFSISAGYNKAAL
jgi:hypothetical protein